MLRYSYISIELSLFSLTLETRVATIFATFISVSLSFSLRERARSRGRVHVACRAFPRQIKVTSASRETRCSADAATAARFPPAFEQQLSLFNVDCHGEPFVTRAGASDHPDDSLVSVIDINGASRAVRDGSFSLPLSFSLSLSQRSFSKSPRSNNVTHYRPVA